MKKRGIKIFFFTCTLYKLKMKGRVSASKPQLPTRGTLFHRAVAAFLCAIIFTNNWHTSVRFNCLLIFSTLLITNVMIWYTNFCTLLIVFSNQEVHLPHYYNNLLPWISTATDSFLTHSISHQKIYNLMCTQFFFLKSLLH